MSSRPVYRRSLRNPLRYLRHSIDSCRLGRSSRAAKPHPMLRVRVWSRRRTDAAWKAPAGWGTQCMCQSARAARRRIVGALALEPIVGSRDIRAAGGIYCHNPGGGGSEGRGGGGAEGQGRGGDGYEPLRISRRCLPGRSNRLTMPRPMRIGSNLATKAWQGGALCVSGRRRRTGKSVEWRGPSHRRCPRNRPRLHSHCPSPKPLPPR